MLRLSHIHLCSEHFTERDFINFMVEYQMGFASKQHLYGCPQGNQLGKNSSSSLQGWSWRAASTEHDTKNWDTPIPWNKCQQGKHKKSNTNAYGRRGCERDSTCSWQTKKQTTNACGKQKMAAQQTADTKWKKQNHLKNPNCCLPASTRWRKTKNKTHQITTVYNRLLSATKEWMTTVIRAQSKNYFANDQQMESHS